MTEPIATPATIPASPDVLALHGEPGWEAARRLLGLASAQRPAAVALPRTPADVIAVAEHARVVGLELRVHADKHSTESGDALAGVLLVSLTRLAGDQERSSHVAQGGRRVQ
jgi:hypothetical protein